MLSNRRRFCKTKVYHVSFTRSIEKAANAPQTRMPPLVCRKNKISIAMTFFLKSIQKNDYLAASIIAF